MAIRQVKVSDISGEEGADFTVVLRDYPGADGARQFDINKAELDALRTKAASDIITVEIRLPTSGPEEIVVKKTDLDKWMGKPDDVLAASRGMKGRQPGYSPRMNGG